MIKRGQSRQLAWEAAGLTWLAEGPGPRIVTVLALERKELRLERLSDGAYGPGAAAELGRALAQLHTTEFPFGVGPPGWAGNGYIGPGVGALDLPLGAASTWGVAYSRQLRQVADKAAQRGDLPAEEHSLVERLCERLESGALDDGVSPARVHGDLWAGNVLWHEGEAVLIDPAAHVGHPQLDLGVLELFGLEHLDHLLGAYTEVNPLPEDWRTRQSLHQVLHLLVHVACFGGRYLGPVRLALQHWA